MLNVGQTKKLPFHPTPEVHVTCDPTIPELSHLFLPDAEESYPGNIQFNSPSFTSEQTSDLQLSVSSILPDYKPFRNQDSNIPTMTCPGTERQYIQEFTILTHSSFPKEVIQHISFGRSLAAGCGGLEVNRKKYHTGAIRNQSHDLPQTSWNEQHSCVCIIPIPFSKKVEILGHT